MHPTPVLHSIRVLRLPTGLTMTLGCGRPTPPPPGGDARKCCAGETQPSARPQGQAGPADNA